MCVSWSVPRVQTYSRIIHSRLCCCSKKLKCPAEFFINKRIITKLFHVLSFIMVKLSLPAIRQAINDLKHFQFSDLQMTGCQVLFLAGGLTEREEAELVQRIERSAVRFDLDLNLNFDLLP